MKKLIRLTETDLYGIVDGCLRKYLNENTNDRKVNKLLKDYYHTDDFTKIREYRANFLNIIPNARSRNEKWLYRVLQWYLDGDIPREEIKRLDKFLGWLNNHECENEDVNNSDWRNLPFLWIKQVYDRLFPYKKAVSSNSDLANKVTKVNGFTIRRIDSQKEARELGRAVYNGEWCILDNLFDEQVDECTCYIISNDKTYKRAKPMNIKYILKILRNIGQYEMAKELRSEEIEDVYELIEYSSICDEYFDLAFINNGLPPYDTYGLSAIVVLVGQDGDLYGVYSRYNLPNMYDGSLFDKIGLSRLIGVDIDTVCPYVNK